MQSGSLSELARTRGVDLAATDPKGSAAILSLCQEATEEAFATLSSPPSIIELVTLEQAQRFVLEISLNLSHIRRHLPALGVSFDKADSHLVEAVKQLGKAHDMHGERRGKGAVSETYNESWKKARQSLRLAADALSKSH